MYSVTIYMSTYNGEKYIQQQVESILKQNEVNVNLVIRDDGSEDNTRDILKKFEKHHNVTIYYGENLGYANSFLTLLKDHAESDYYGFADQDDYWDPNKIISAIDKLNFSKSQYSVYASALKVVDEKLFPISMKQFDNMKCSVGSILSRNRLAGCTMVFKKELKKYISKDIGDILVENQYKFGHDGWILLYALLLGGNIVIDNKSYIYYRRHSSTVTNISSGIKKRLFNEWIIFINKDNRRQKIASFLLKRDNDFFDKEALNILEMIVKYQKNLIVKLKLLIGKYIKTNIKIVDIKNKLAILIGRF